MIDDIEIRESLPNDRAAIETLYPDAFPDEDLLPLVRDLLSNEASGLSLVALVDRALVGHVIFTACGIAKRAEKVALLAPLGVATKWHRRGIGGALVRAGLDRLNTDGVAQVYVLGDPAYYGRFGFEREDGVVPPYPLPEEWQGAWQSLRLREVGPPLQGELSVPRPWRQAALWVS
jgi:putative acetyltransferase